MDASFNAFIFVLPEIRNLLLRVWVSYLSRGCSSFTLSNNIKLVKTDM